MNISQIMALNGLKKYKPINVLEEIYKKDNYNGIRIKRCLFSSAKNKLINADLNGAINIMRKFFIKNKIQLTEITGMKIYNPVSVKLPREAVHPA